MSEPIKTKTAEIHTLFTELLVNIGRAEVCLDKNVIEEPNLSLLTDTLNDLEAIFEANFGREEGSLLGVIRDKSQILADAIS